MLYPDFHELIALKSRKCALPFAREKRLKSIVAGNHYTPFRGQGLEFDAVREYVPGDDVRRIDWRVTARTGSPYIKLFKEERERRLCVCIDMNSSMRFGTKNTFKSVQAARIAALIGWQAIAQQDRVGACLFGDVPGGIQLFPSSRTKHSFYSLLKMVSAPPAEHHKVGLKELVLRLSRAAEPGALVYLISDFMELEKDASLLQLAKRCDVILVTVNDPTDKDLFAAGTLRFSVPGKERMVIDTDSRAGREKYATQWRENRQALRAIASASKVPIWELSTESDVYREFQRWGRKRR